MMSSVFRDEQSMELLLRQDCASVIGRDLHPEIYRCLSLIRGAVVSRVVKGAIAEVEERPFSVPYLLLSRLPEILVREIVSGVGVGHELRIAGKLSVGRGAGHGVSEVIVLELIWCPNS